MKIVLPGDLYAALAERVQAAVPASEIVTLDNDARPQGDISDAQVLLRWWFSPQQLNALIAAMPALRWLHLPHAGVDRVLVPALVERDDIVITNSSGVHAVPIAEFVMMFVLNHAKQARSLYAYQQQATWAQHELSLLEVAGKTMLIIGMGQIGQALAVRAAAFGMHVIGSRRSATPTPGVDHLVGEGEWRAHLGEADFVVVATPLTPQTRNMFGAAELAAMRPDAYLINIARGGIIDEDALLEALHAGRIAGAGLDVFASEPLPSESPFWAMPNVFATPHISFSSPEVRPRTIALFIDNLRRFAAGEPLLNVVDRQAGY